MNISDMHITFRQYAQQMGMQNVRNILPGQIDILLNTAQTDVLNQIIRENVGVGGDNTANTNKLYEVNVLKSLIKSASKQVVDNQFNINNDTYFLMSITADIYHEPKDNYEVTDTYEPECQIRLINVARLGETLHDAILKPTYYSPIACLTENGLIKIYVGKKRYANSVVEPKIKNVTIHYVKKPTTINYTDINHTVSDMDVSLHELIVRRATELYLASIRKTPINNQQNQTQQ